MTWKRSREGSTRPLIGPGRSDDDRPAGADAAVSDLPRVVRPVEQRLPLFRSTLQVAGPTVVPNLGDMPPHGPPPLHLPLVIRRAAAEVVSTIPLKPASRVVGADPAFPVPLRQRLRGVDSEKIKLAFVSFVTELGPFEPTGRELVPAVSHVPATEHTEL